MSVLPVLTGTENTVLRTVSKKIPKVNRDVLELIKKMQETVVVENGVGLAAPQVGHNVRLILVKLANRFLPMINPELREFSQEQCSGEEGCLSVPGKFGMVLRAKEVLVEFLDEAGKEQRLRLKDFEARIVQHEIDHLDGVLFVDRIEKTEKHPSSDRKEMAL
jgi:peptide deformylase